MVIQTRDYTAKKFDDFVGLPQNRDKLFEFIGGEIVEVPSNETTQKWGLDILKWGVEHHNSTT